MAAPPNMPPALATKISDAIREAFKTPEAVQLLKNIHATPIMNSPEEARAFIQTDSKRWKDVIISNNIQGE